jgi:hypothetical protein
MLIRLASSVVALALLAGIVSAQSNQDADAGRPMSWRCLAPPTEPCFTHRGRLSGQNGIAYMIWLVGTKRIVAVHERRVRQCCGSIWP